MAELVTQRPPIRSLASSRTNRRLAAAMRRAAAMPAAPAPTIATSRSAPLCARTTDGAATTAAETARNERRLSPDMVSDRLLEADRMPEHASSGKLYG